MTEPKEAETLKPHIISEMLMAFIDGKHGPGITNYGSGPGDEDGMRNVLAYLMEHHGLFSTAQSLSEPSAPDVEMWYRRIFSCIHTVEKQVTVMNGVPYEMDKGFRVDAPRLMAIISEIAARPAANVEANRAFDEDEAYKLLKIRNADNARYIVKRLWMWSKTGERDAYADSCYFDQTLAECVNVKDEIKIVERILDNQCLNATGRLKARFTAPNPQAGCGGLLAASKAGKAALGESFDEALRDMSGKPTQTEDSHE